MCRGNLADRVDPRCVTLITKPHHCAVAQSQTPEGCSLLCYHDCATPALYTLVVYTTRDLHYIHLHNTGFTQNGLRCICTHCVKGGITQRRVYKESIFELYLGEFTQKAFPTENLHRTRFRHRIYIERMFNAGITQNAFPTQDLHRIYTIKRIYMACVLWLKESSTMHLLLFFLLFLLTR